jgi:hypothetical protein
VAAESILGVPAVWPALLDNLYVSTRRHTGARRRATESRDTWESLGHTTNARTADAARRCTAEAYGS